MMFIVFPDLVTCMAKKILLPFQNATVHMHVLYTMCMCTGCLMSVLENVLVISWFVILYSFNCSYSLNIVYTFVMKYMCI